MTVESVPARVDRQALVLDAVLVVFTAVVTVLALVGSTRLVDRTEAGGPGWLLAPALAGVLLARRGFPLAVLVVSIGLVLLYYASGRPAVGLELPLAAAFFSAAEQGRVRAAAVTAGVLIAGTYAVRMGFGQDPVRLLALEVPVTLVVLAGAIGAGDAVRSRWLRVAAETERQRLLAAERAAEARALVAEERRAVTREVHDVLGHSMVVIGTQSEVALDALDDHAQVEASLRNIQATARTGLADIRQSVRLLAREGEPREPVATLAGLPELLHRIRAAGAGVRLREVGEPRPLPIAIDTTAYRVVQEGLTNVVKHSQAREAGVEIRYAHHELVVLVADPGPAAELAPNASSAPAPTADPDPASAPGAGPAPGAGSDSKPNPGQGLTGLTERVAMVGGTLDAGRDPGGPGFRLRARFPLPVVTPYRDEPNNADDLGQ